MSEQIFEPIKATDEEVLAAIRRKTAYALPDHPTAQGMKPEAIRRRLYAAMIDPEASVLAEMQRIVGEANAALAQVLEKAFHYEGDMADLLANDAVREEVVKRAEAAAGRVDAGLRADDLYIRYSAYPDGRDYKEKWARGLNYIGVAAGLYEPTDASGYEWSVFAPGLYVGSGDMPDYADVQIDPEGENDWSGEGNFGKNNTVNMKGYYIKGIDKENCKVYLSAVKLPLEELKWGAEACADCYDATFPTPAYRVGEAFNIINDHHYPWCAAISDIEHNVVTYTTTHAIEFANGSAEEIELSGLAFDGFKADEAVDGHTFGVPAQSDVGVVQITFNAFSSGVVNNSAGDSGASLGGANLNISNYSFTAGRNGIAGYASAAIGFFCAALMNALAAGECSMAWAEGAVALGIYARALAYGQVALGKFNTLDPEGKYICLVGNGIPSCRHDAMRVGMDGALYLDKGSTRVQEIAFTVGSDEELDAITEWGGIVHPSSNGYNGSVRYCDRDVYITYCYPIKDAGLVQRVTWWASMNNQVKLDVSTDPNRGVWHNLIDRGDQIGAFSIEPLDLTPYIDPDETKCIYIRLSDSHPSDGFGGAISVKHPVSLKIYRFKMPTLIE